MNLKIGSIIKKLRIENNTTQDTLGASLGVSPQAISRWESESGYPDIELLPALADFFGISIDELLGYRLSEREAALERIKEEMSRLSENGTIDERIAFARKAYSRYPSNNDIKGNLAVCLYHQWEETHNNTLITEIESLCYSIIESTNDPDTQYKNIFTLISLYGETNESEKAKELVNMLMPMKYCRENVLSAGIGDGNTEYYIQDQIDKLTDCLALTIRHLVLCDDLPNDPSTWDKKIQMLKTANELYHMIYGDNLMYIHERLSYNHWIISTYEIAQGKTEDAFISIEKMCYHSIESCKSYENDHGKPFTSIFTDKLIYPINDDNFEELCEHTTAYYALENLEHKRYNCIRNDSRFVSIVETLKEYSK